MSAPTVTPVDPTAVRAAAQAALENRLVHIDTIVAAQNTRAETTENVRAAQQADADAAAAEEAAFRAAVAGGWSVAELRRAGLAVPDAVARPGAKRTGRGAPTGRRGRRTVAATVDTDSPAIETASDDGTGSTGSVDARTAGGAEVHQ
ncbi:hypothetical protein [Rhodococcoides corynebacterioides]|uniref:hypothetical protein n=1 Tax=Rhodococcoides corynebacterioides TaxID=53972 RepID=UPI001C9BB9F8|nr:hypothetical protein [Rhodococcus corynebacterioides]MBY6352061.1 hypothetical protein [Rhodococcus corynebacterioides]